VVRRQENRGSGSGVEDRGLDLRRFYGALDILAARLGGSRKLVDCTGRDKWPERGIYFFQERGELRTDTGDGLRIVRVGTHALKLGSATRLWTRLSQHKGVVKTGGGNHRGSIFRLTVGAALIDRDGLSGPTWGNGSSAPRDIRESEQALEQAVSTEVGEMPFLWLGIDDAAGPNSLRGYIERNAIALLSNFGKRPLDASSTGWLGCFSSRKRVRDSGLWNSNHVSDTYDPAFLDRLENLVS